jgi:CheY-like chemotaxis protein
MHEAVFSIASPVIVLAISVFVIYRLKVGRLKESEGAGFVYVGVALVFIGSLVNLLQQHPGYGNWFLEGVYFFISLAEFLSIVTGLVLFVVGLVLHFNYWSDRDVAVASHLEKLRLLDNIQQESRYPYPTLELLDRVLKSMLTGLDEEAGAVFLLNRAQRKFVLATSVGLSKEENALLEYYPYGRNIVSQVIEEGSAMISADFRSLGGKAQIVASKFRSILVVPLISGRSKLGALLLFAREERHYSTEFIGIVSPIAEWLSEKIEVSRLTRDLRKSRESAEEGNRKLADFQKKLYPIIAAAGATPSVSEFASRCAGLIDADEVWLLGLTGGALTFHGGTAAKADFSENFRAAVVNAIARGKAVILNQEATDESGQSFIARASLLLPIGKGGNAMLLRNNSGAVSVSGEDLQALEAVASAAGMVIDYAEAKTVSFSRSKGIKAVADVLNIKLEATRVKKGITAFVAGLTETLPPGTVLLFYRRDNERFRVAYSNADNASLNDVSIAVGEGPAGKAAALRIESASFDSKEVSEGIMQYDDENRDALRSIFGDRRTPAFRGDYPIIAGDRVDFILSVFGFEESPAENMEQHRLLSLLAALMNLRVGIAYTEAARTEAVLSTSAPTLPAEELNELNNDLSAISGYCQLARRDENLSGRAARAFDSILESAEKMAGRLKILAIKEGDRIAEEFREIDLADVIRETFDRDNISGNLHMVNGRPLTVNLDLKDVPKLKVGRDRITRLVKSAVRTFSGHVDDDEIITLRSYAGSGFIYIDVSKHRANFPPVEPVAGFGKYTPPASIEGEVRYTELLNLLAGFSGEFAFDRHSRVPSYFSFRFRPTIPEVREALDERKEGLTILAVDDQSVILDLLAAMCQSLGYNILTARDGAEGLREFESHRPDIVISDLAMPGMSGWELASRIKSLSPRTPVIIITGWGVSIDEEKMRRAGVDFVLHKPFRLEQLSDLISKVRFSGVQR